MTFVDREPRCFIARKVSTKRRGHEFQEMLAESVQGHDYRSFPPLFIILISITILYFINERKALNRKAQLASA